VITSAFKPRKPLDCLARPTKIYALGFSLRKREIVRQFLGAKPIEFINDAQAIHSPDVLLLWGRTAAPSSLPDNIQIIRLEDGFLRSVGLGADLIQPVSWVIDASGIYFDATQASDLETFLQTYAFDDELLARAENLRHSIIDAGITKYNVGAKSWSPSAASSAKKIILVPGQVETDASIQYGALGINTNLGLLKAVREQNAATYILYKPHPDVVAGLRAKGENEEAAASFCDEIIIDVAMDELLLKVDEVHVLTSLTGFEALLRGKTVHCYGLPFYAGWGLTQDALVCSRRTRALDLSMLCAAALILYPTYISRRYAEHITPEMALAELIEWRGQSRPLRWYESTWRAVLRRVLRRP
jgi:capsular polysaccharide export protein